MYILFISEILDRFIQRFIKNTGIFFIKVENLL